MSDMKAVPTEVQATSKRELELELQLWRERLQSVQNSAQAVNLQAQLLQFQAQECKANVARLEEMLLPKE